MKSARIVAPGRVEVDEVADLTVQPGTAVVRPLVIAIDGSDTRRVYNGAPDSYPLAPSTCAHQVVGRVEAIEYVGVKPLPFVVDEVAIVRRPGFDGLAEQILVPIGELIHQTLDTPLERLVLVHQLARALMAAERLRDVVGRSVAVIGQGPAGLVLDAVLRRAGARQVIGIDPVATRRDAALRFGATAVVDPGGGAADAAAQVAAVSGAQLPDVVVEAAGSADSINLAVALVRAEGRLLLYGEPRAPTFPFDYGVLYEKQCAVVMSTPGTYEADGYHAYRLATNHLARGDFAFDGLVTHRLPLDDAARAYELSRTGDDGACQVVIELGS
ncbi:MAG: zinc-binding dehydrogenase [Spirochaetaceae bacterium]|nr:zinc-binding dehydrogenase [Spirochaetaceae bacterium]